ncbi:MAG TPA: hypothetical protein VGM83_00510 [Devosiaceae bacterium]|jgi:hypothetical protein
MSDSNDDSEDFGRYLPVPLYPRAPKPSLARSSTEASFLSHLIAAHERLPQQREKHRAPADEAVGAYRSSANSAVLRMPKGYRRTVIV